MKLSEGRKSDGAPVNERARGGQRERMKGGRMNGGETGKRENNGQKDFPQKRMKR